MNWILRVTRWKMFFAGWHHGTVPANYGPARETKDHREITISLRVENNALAALLVSKGVFTAEEWTKQVQYEARLLHEDFVKRFPGFDTYCNDEDGGGLVINDTKKAAITAAKLNFPP